MGSGQEAQKEGSGFFAEVDECISSTKNFREDHHLEIHDGPTQDERLDRQIAYYADMADARQALLDGEPTEIEGLYQSAVDQLLTDAGYTDHEGVARTKLLELIRLTSRSTCTAFFCSAFQRGPFADECQ